MFVYVIDLFSECSHLTISGSSGAVQYPLRRVISSSSEACIYLSRHPRSGVCVVKAAKGLSWHLIHEASVLEGLQGMHGIPTLLGYCVNGCKHSALAIWPRGEVLSCCGMRMARDDLIDVFLTVVSILRAVHKRHLAHMDISPDNIIVYNGHVYVIDWGCAKRIGSNTHFVGKPLFASTNMLQAKSCAKTASVSASDDLESVYKSAMYMLKTTRPWPGKIESHDACRRLLLALKQN